MFDPTVGRWLEEDPKGFDAGDPNLFRYVKNNPTNATDPSGQVIFTNGPDAAKAVWDWIKGMTGVELDQPHGLPVVYDWQTGRWAGSDKWVIQAVPPSDHRYDLLKYNADRNRDGAPTAPDDRATAMNRYNLLYATLSNSGISVYIPESVERIRVANHGEILVHPTDDTIERFPHMGPSRGVGRVWELANSHAGKPPVLSPKANAEEMEEARKYMNDNRVMFPRLKLNINYIIYGPTGRDGVRNYIHNYSCAGLVEVAQQLEWNWKAASQTRLPLEPVGRDYLEAQLRAIGFANKADNYDLEDNRMKIVVYGTKSTDNKIWPRHYALQTPDGKWIGKLGQLGPTIIHDDVKDLTEGAYGDIIGAYYSENHLYKKK
jgi:hypothetical protein